MDAQPHRHEGAIALREQVEALHPASFGWAMSLCRRDRVEAEEVLHCAYAKIIGGEARYDGRAAFKTWLFGVIRLTAYEHRRRGVLRALRTVFLGEEPPRDSRPPEEKVALSEQARIVKAALVRLPDRQREVLHLVFYEGLTIAEAAVAMSVSLGAARQHYERGKAKLRGELTRPGQEKEEKP